MQAKLNHPILGRMNLRTADSSENFWSSQSKYDFANIKTNTTTAPGSDKIRISLLC